MTYTQAIRSTRCGRKQSGPPCVIYGAPPSDSPDSPVFSRPEIPLGRTNRGPLDRDPLERLGVLITGPLAHVPMPLPHELLEVPLPARLGHLALVLPQCLDLPIERRRDVDQVIAQRPERDPDLFHLVRLESLLEQRPERAR